MIFVGDCREILRTWAPESVQCCVTSPPYWGLRDYGHADQLGLEKTPEEYVANMVDVFRDVRRILRDDGTLWLNIGDSYAHGGNGSRDAERWPKQHRNAHGFRSMHAKSCPDLKPKDLVGIPWRLAFALQTDGWYLRSDIIWHKPNPMPEPVTDRPTRAHEYVFLRPCRRSTAPTWTARWPNLQLPDTRQATYETRNRRDVWTLTTQPFKGAHFAVMPEALVEPCILAGAPKGSIVMDPFTGAGTVWAVAQRLGRQFRGIELNPEYASLAVRRVLGDPDPAAPADVFCPLPADPAPVPLTPPDPPD